jgi:hypothetical protein
MWIRKADWELGVKTVAFIVVVMLGIVGNVLLLSVVVRNRSMRSPTNLLIANMAVADLVTLAVLPWVFTCIDSFQNYILGEVGCKAQGFLECEYELLIVCLEKRLISAQYTIFAFGYEVVSIYSNTR